MSSKLSKSDLIVTTAILGWIIFILSSPLAFIPIPWPDAPAFYLPARAIFQWPPHWINESLIAFEPTNATANFSSLPGLPILLGIAYKLGLETALGATLMTRAVCLAGLGLLGWLLYQKTSANLGGFFATLLALTLVADPQLRWGTLVVRPEIFIVLLGFAILNESKLEKPKSWLVGLLLALAAFFHFDAVVLIPMTVTVFWKNGWKSTVVTLIRIALWALLFLSPGWIYVLLHPHEFVAQMTQHFNRLGPRAIPWSHLYELFHGMFQNMGNPVHWPKILNFGKILFWALALAASLVTFAAILLKKRNVRLLLGSGLLFWFSVRLWRTHPEAWFVTLPHAFLWIWLSELIPYLRGSGKKMLAFTLILFLGVSLIVTTRQYAEMPAHYTWRDYRSWRDCIFEFIPNKEAKVWQPFAPDLLVELKSRGQTGILTSVADWGLTAKGLEDLARNQNIILLAQFLRDADPLSPRVTEIYHGPMRTFDHSITSDGTVPTASLALKVGSEVAICQQGPFWAGIVKVKQNN